MLRGYRRIFLAIAGLALAGAQEPAKQTQAASSPQQAQTTPKPATPPAQTAQPPYRPYTDRYSDACYNAQNHDTADLCAQWRAAIATEKAAKEARIATIAAIIGVVLSLATVVGLIVTIWQTHGALGEARRGNRLNLAFERRSRRESRKAAQDQERALAIADRNAEAAASHVRVAEDTARRQLRAYIGIETMVVQWQDAAHPTFHMVVRNVGKTPATIIRHVRNYKLEPANNLVTFSPEIWDEMDDVFHPIVMGPTFPQTSIERFTEPFTPLQIDYVRKGVLRLYVSGEMKYLDAFDCEWRTGYSFVAKPDMWGLQEMMVTHSEGNYFT